MDLSIFRRAVDRRQLGETEARALAALRLWVMARKCGRGPGPAIEERLGSAQAVIRLQLMLEKIGAAWPEPFLVSPPCCRRLSLDEAVFVEMLQLGRAGDRAGFDRLLAEMIPGEARERLFLSAVALSIAPGGR
jgi:hypothetical protein